MVNHVYHYLLNYNLKDFHHNAPVEDTEAAIHMMKKSVAAYQEHLQELIDDEVAPFDQTYIVWQDIKYRLEVDGYKPADRGVRSVLKMNGFEHYHGAKWVGDKTGNIRRWSKKSDILDNMKPGELYDELSK